MRSEKKMNRRKFLKIAGGVVGASTLACVGAGFLGTRQPKVDLPRTECRGDERRVLVAYASRTGSTAEIAMAIGETLCEAGASVDVLPASQVTDLSPYGAVVVGSAAYMGRWLGDAVTCLRTHQDALKQLPVAYFTGCLTLQEDTEENRTTVAAYLDPVYEEIAVEPVAVGLFAGRLDTSKVSFVYRLVIQKMGQSDADYRDWDAIAAWAGTLPEALALI